MMPRVLVINPNSSVECTRGIDQAVAGLQLADGQAVNVIGLEDGPPAILSWRDWHAAAEPICCAIEREPADVYVIACASDPGLEAARAVTARPVLGVFRCGVAAAMVRAERFGVVAIVEASRGRHMAALRSMGVEARLAAEVALNTSMQELLDEHAARARLIAAAQDCVGAGAGAVLLGCTGMAGHRAAVEAGCGVPVIEPCRAAVGLALAGLS